MIPIRLLHTYSQQVAFQLRIPVSQNIPIDSLIYDTSTNSLSREITDNDVYTA